MTSWQYSLMMEEKHFTSMRRCRWQRLLLRTPDQAGGPVLRGKCRDRQPQGQVCA
jgi:hypothetical protein